MTVREALISPSESRRSEWLRFMRFTGVGLVAASANVLSRLLFSRLMIYALAVAAAYLTGMIVAFTLSRLFIFRSRARSWRGELLRFSVVNAASFVQVWLVSVFLAEWLLPRLGVIAHRETMAHMIGVASPIAFSYLGHKHFSFRG